MSRYRSLFLPFFVACFIAFIACSDGAKGDSESADASQIEQPDAASITDSGLDDPDAGELPQDASVPDPDSGTTTDPDEVVFDVEVVSTWPLDGSTGIPIAASISITFNQAMFPNSLTVASSNSDTRDHNVALMHSGTNAPIPLTKKDSSDKITFVYTPNGLLDAKTDYTLTIRGGGDAGENNDTIRSQRNTRMKEDFTLSFTTAAADDIVDALTVTSITPVDGATDVSNSTSVKVTFSQPIQSSTLYLVPDGQGASPKTQGTFWLSDSSAFLFPEPGTLTLSSNLTEATFALKPGAALKGDTMYHVGIKGCADTQNPANSPCLRALSGARLGEDFTASFVTTSATTGTIKDLYALAESLTSDSDVVAANVRIAGATMTYYRDVSNNEGFFMQRQEEIGGQLRHIGIYVNTLTKHPSLPVWPMFQSSIGWTSDTTPEIESEELALFADYPVIDIEVTSIGTYQGMAYVKTDGYPTLSRVSGQQDKTLAELIDDGMVPTFDSKNLNTVMDEHLGTLVQIEGKPRWTGSQNSAARVWFDLRWGTNTSGGVIIDNVHKIRLLLSQDQMDLLGLQKVKDRDQATVRVIAPVQKGKFSGDELLYVQPTKLSSVECTGSSCTALPRTSAELNADPELMRDIVKMKDSTNGE